MKYKKLKNIITILNGQTFNQEALVSRNISELIKLIPYIGSIINANTLDILKDKKLEKRLNELENSIVNTISISEGEILLDIIEENRNLLYTLIAQFQDLIFQENKNIKNNLSSYLMIPKKSLNVFTPNNEFKLVIISGASAIGKDTVIDKIIKKDFPQTAHVDLFTKYSTRKRRIMDSHYYKFLSASNYEKYLNNDKIIFPYTKREHSYGFNKNQLFAVSQTSTILFCVFTEFKILPQAKKYLNEQGISSIFILFEAPEKDLIDRSWRRNFSEDEVRRRINSIRQDAHFIENNNELINKLFDHRIDNSDKKAIDKTCDEIVEIVSKNATQKCI